jgi:hypothetical protein
MTLFVFYKISLIHLVNFQALHLKAFGFLTGQTGLLKLKDCVLSMTPSSIGVFMHASLHHVLPPMDIV